MERTTQIKESKPAPPARTTFPSPFVFNKRELVTLVELRMREASGMIRAKPNWWEKVTEDTTIAKWREEIIEQDRAFVDQLWGGEGRMEYGNGDKQWPRDPITDAQLDYIFDELRYEAERRDAHTGIFATAVEKVYESRSLIPQELKDTLVKGVSILEDVPEDKKHWHPGSNNQVLDLVHPSMYCLRIGESYIRKDNDAVDHPVELLTEDKYMSGRPDLAQDGDWVVSRKYQWLPTDFQLSDSGEVKALAYINNLHPMRHAALYPCIESILARFMPLFERVLTAALSVDPPLAINVDPHRWYDNIREYEEEEDYEEWQRTYQWPTIPDPAPFEPYEPAPESRAEYSLRGRKIQVIVKLANIVLTPDNPKYPGGSWHVEGMANERIVATGLYYYACENITESRLDFRAVVGDEDAASKLPYQQSDHRGFVVAYGFGMNHFLNQTLGQVFAEEDKCVAFPNIYQHCVNEFELEDPSKPGYRKILCFFLVNPDVEILSTTVVPPQQADWSINELEKSTALSKLPQELFEMVAGYVREGMMTREEAEQQQQKLMEERADFVMEHNERVYELGFAMCEH
ncbi:hypothetical protein C8Q80DRAFT_1276274 [Daedaleopsis nitida]|nr:hypothetical protein C8Q80DRAFT_1276274 [Daedaleopsis nitida]